MNNRLLTKALPIMLVTVLAAACTVGPEYVRAPVETPVKWRNTSETYWQKAAPTHAALDPDWWQQFQDPILNGLEQQALAGNQTLKAAVAHYEQARASLSITSSAALPSLGVQGNAARNKTSDDRPQQNYSTPVQSTTQNDFMLRTTLSYEVDLFGRIRREVEGARAAETAAADDLANARLVLTADVAAQYLALRESDDEIDILEKSTILRQKALDFVSTRHNLGVVSGLDVLQQRTQLDNTRTQLELLRKQREQYEHTIATLVGVAAPDFSVSPVASAPLSVTSPANAGPGQTRLAVLPLAMPSTLLQRRPDIASAERAMAEANARIGVAQSAYYPDITLSPSIGWESTRFASMLSAPALLWSLGSSAAEVIFDGGKRHAGVQFAKQDYLEVQADYRQTVLNAFQQVQDAVTGLAVLENASKQAQSAVTDGRQLLDLANERYAGGLAQFIDVINAEQQMLQNERQAVQIRGQQAATVVYLAKALGGGWQAESAQGGEHESPDHRG